MSTDINNQTNAYTYKQTGEKEKGKNKTKLFISFSLHFLGITDNETISESTNQPIA